MTPPPFLVVDDDGNDLLLFRRAAERAGIPYPVEVAEDGDEAIVRLGQADRPIPLVVVVDLKMRGCSGFDLLRWVRAQPGLKRLPVVIFTSSNQDEDVAMAWELGASGYLVKPVSNAERVALVQLLASWWGANARPRFGP